MRRVLGVMLTGAVVLVVGCSSDDRAPKTPLQSPPSTHSPRAPAPTTTSPQDTERPRPIPQRKEVRVKHRGVDASHHQGAIDWNAVANDGVSFAYLKATEGTTYTDPTFAGHRAAAQDAGLEVGGYHYFQLCSPGVDQARHFNSVLGDLDGDDLPPAVDLELAGSCPTPPPRAILLAEVRAFLEQVEATTEREPVVYLYPEFEEEYGVAGALGEYRQWVRSLDGRPDREWWIWQQTDSGSVDGIAGPVDVNLIWTRETVAR
ncbi:glycoside hydrolase family 25 protein [Nocardioides bizhenqiangii]|uniref:GH25 family lysozyme n=1 Tax=Nocardioides bizhenqiangii TaxID=3095076 RepID=A0ABZ0ZRX1_9ACTN|nr:GH25 family lysozyme [Nocardioides sp. HM61]WQQ26521.1 GH25 family lysozyme [Nocardioides sp. HM61]